MTRTRRITWKIITDRVAVSETITNQSNVNILPSRTFRRSTVKPRIDEEFLFED